jgi:hypothetical protein
MIQTYRCQCGEIIFSNDFTQREDHKKCVMKEKELTRSLGNENSLYAIAKKEIDSVSNIQV